MQLEAAETPAQAACKQYATTLAAAQDRDSILTGLEAAQKMAAASTDADARRVAGAIDQVLTASVVGTQASVQAANQQVIDACAAAGTTLRME